MDELKELIKKHYHNSELSEEQLRNLGQMQERQSFNTLKWTYSLVACLVIAFTLNFTYNSYSHKNTLEKIAAEVFYNHKKNLPSEFVVDKASELNERLLKIDFKIHDSPKVSEYDVLGGRYCSIQGRTAAQIKLKHQGNVSTLYQTDFLKVERSKLPYKTVMDGVEVLIWIEKETLFAKATTVGKTL